MAEVFDATDDPMGLDIDMSLKKKKKKKRVAFPDEEEDGSSPSGGLAGDGDDVDALLDDPLAMFGTKKKKKKKKKKVAVEAPGEEQKTSWANSDRDYDYFELLDRIQSLLEEKGQVNQYKDTKLRLPPPELVRDGTTKTVWANFATICKRMHRSLDHMLSYTLAELGTTGSVDGNQRLTIRGRFQPKQVESVIRHYVTEFIKCNTCGSTDTELEKENRMHFLHCNTCRSRRTVQAIKQGYVAQVRRRRRRG